MRHRFPVGFVLFMAVSSVFAAKKFADYPHKQPAEHQLHFADDKFSIGLDVVRDNSLLDEYFGSDLVADGLLPVYVVIENLTANQPYLFSTSDLASAAISGGEEAGVVDLHAVPGESGGSATGVTVASGAIIATGTIFAPVAMIAAGVLTVKAENSRHNLLSKELRSQSISPGETIRGFVFLPVSEETYDEAMLLRLRLRAPGRGTESHQYDFFLPSPQH